MGSISEYEPKSERITTTIDARNKKSADIVEEINHRHAKENSERKNLKTPNDDRKASYKSSDRLKGYNEYLSERVRKPSEKRDRNPLSPRNSYEHDKNEKNFGTNRVTGTQAMKSADDTGRSFAGKTTRKSFDEESAARTPDYRDYEKTFESRNSSRGFVDELKSSRHSSRSPSKISDKEAGNERSIKKSKSREDDDIPLSRKSPTTKSPRSISPIPKSPASKSPRSKSPVSKSPRSKFPVSKSPRSKSPVSKSPRSKKLMYEFGTSVDDDDDDDVTVNSNLKSRFSPINKVEDEKSKKTRKSSNYLTKSIRSESPEPKEDNDGKKSDFKVLRDDSVSETRSTRKSSSHDSQSPRRKKSLEEKSSHKSRSSESVPESLSSDVTRARDDEERKYAKKTAKSPVYISELNNVLAEKQLKKTKSNDDIGFFDDIFGMKEKSGKRKDDVENVKDKDKQKEKRISSLSKKEKDDSNKTKVKVKDKDKEKDGKKKDKKKGKRGSSTSDSDEKSDSSSDESKAKKEEPSSTTPTFSELTAIKRNEPLLKNTAAKEKASLRKKTREASPMERKSEDGVSRQRSVDGDAGEIVDNIFEENSTPKKKALQRQLRVKSSASDETKEEKVRPKSLERRDGKEKRISKDEVDASSLKVKRGTSSDDLTAKTKQEKLPENLSIPRSSSASNISKFSSSPKKDKSLNKSTTGKLSSTQNDATYTVPTNSSDLKEMIYHQWLEKKKVQTKEEIKAKMLAQKRAAQQAEAEANDRKATAQKIYDAWNDSKTGKILSDKEIKQKQKQAEREKMEEALQRKKDAEKYFETWKREKDEKIKEMVKQKKKEEKQKDKEKFHLKRQTSEEALKAFESWKTQKARDVADQKKREEEEKAKVGEEKLMAFEKKQEALRVYEEWKNNSKKSPRAKSPPLMQRSWLPAGRNLNNIIPEKVQPVIVRNRNVSR